MKRSETWRHGDMETEWGSGREKVWRKGGKRNRREGEREMGEEMEAARWEGRASGDPADPYF